MSDRFERANLLTLKVWLGKTSKYSIRLVSLVQVEGYLGRKNEVEVAVVVFGAVQGVVIFWPCPLIKSWLDVRYYSLSESVSQYASV